MLWPIRTTRCAPVVVHTIVDFRGELRCEVLDIRVRWAIVDRIHAADARAE